MDVEQWVTVVVLVALVVVLVREVVGPATAMVAALVTLVLTRAVEPTVAFSGFSSTATVTVAGLFVVAHAVQEHGGIEGLIKRSLRASSSDRAVLARLCFPVAFASSIVANTPVVAALAPVVRRWFERHGRSPSRALMPLSFAAIVGGTATTIGTSTTLVASGLVEDATGSPLGLLEVTPLGLPLAVLGTGLVVLLGPWLLPDRGDVLGLVADRSYSFRVVVEEGGPLDGVTLLDAGLRDLTKVYVATIDRGAAGTAPARPDSRLVGGDELLVVGDVDLARGESLVGLRHADHHQVAALDDDRTGLHEAVVSRTSTLVGRTLKQVSFRGRYGAAVLAIHRAGARVEGKLGTVVLQPGDTLLVRAVEGFAERWQDTDFAVVAALDEPETAPSPRRHLVFLIAGAMVLGAATEVVSLVEAVLWACTAIVATRTLRFRAAMESLNIEVLLIIAAAIGVGASVEATGLADIVAGGMGTVANGAGAAGALVVLLLGTAVLTEIVTNVASAALLVPVAMRTAEALGEDPRAWAIAVGIGASASFLTPIGYQTNTIVYGLGGYRFSDYWRLGLPMVALTLALTVLIVPRL